MAAGIGLMTSENHTTPDHDARDGDASALQSGGEAGDSDLYPVMDQKQRPGGYWSGFSTSPKVYLFGLSAIGVIALLFISLFMVLG